MTFQEWQATRTWHDNLFNACPHAADMFDESEEGIAGYVYEAGCWIAYLGGQYWAPAGRGDMSGDLAAVEQFLWDEHAKHEVAA